MDVFYSAAILCHVGFGVILWVAPTLSAYINKEPFEISGILIFAYGWGILIIERFREGVEGRNNTAYQESEK